MKHYPEVGGLIPYFLQVCGLTGHSRAARQLMCCDLRSLSVAASARAWLEDPKWLCSLLGQIMVIVDWVI